MGQGLLLCFNHHKKVLTAVTVRTLLFYSDKHINVNITPAYYPTLCGLRVKVFFSIVKIQRKIANLSIFPNYFFSLIAACFATSEK